MIFDSCSLQCEVWRLKAREKEMKLEKAQREKDEKAALARGEDKEEITRIREVGNRNKKLAKVRRKLQRKGYTDAMCGLAEGRQRRARVLEPRRRRLRSIVREKPCGPKASRI